MIMMVGWAGSTIAKTAIFFSSSEEFFINLQTALALDYRQSSAQRTRSVQVQHESFHPPKL